MKKVLTSFTLVDYPIITIIGGSRKNATEGDAYVSLDCTADSKPPARFTWQKTGEASNVKTGTGTSDNNRLVYTIPTVSRRDAGTYRCTAENGIPPPDYSDQELVVFCKSIMNHTREIMNSNPDCNLVNAGILRF